LSGHLTKLPLCVPSKVFEITHCVFSCLKCLVVESRNKQDYTSISSNKGLDAALEKRHALC